MKLINIIEDEIISKIKTISDLDTLRRLVVISELQNRFIAEVDDLYHKGFSTIGEREILHQNIEGLRNKISKLEKEKRTLIDERILTV